jgi:hypothetical protein
MISTASGRSAFIVAAGLLVLLANPVTAATDADDSASAPDSKSTAVTHRTVRHAWHHRRHYVHHRSHALAMKADDDKEADKKAADAAPVPVPFDNKVSSSIPPSIANANAQMLLAGVQLSAAAAVPSGTAVPATASANSANAIANSGTLMAAADQLNDVDKTLQEGASAAAAPADASPSPTTASPPPVAAAATMTNETSTWDQTSLIGKIFIGFGALLTMASAARLFIG